MGKNAVIYTSMLSTQDEMTIEEQRERIESFCSENNINVCSKLFSKSFLDGSRENIGGFLDFLESREKKIHCLIAYSPFHLGASIEDVYSISYHLNEIGTKLIFVETGEYNQNFFEELLLQIKGNHPVLEFSTAN